MEKGLGDVRAVYDGKVIFTDELLTIDVEPQSPKARIKESDGMAASPHPGCRDTHTDAGAVRVVLCG